jgi:hypothetical protein
MNLARHIRKPKLFNRIQEAKHRAWYRHYRAAIWRYKRDTFLDKIFIPTRATASFNQMLIAGEADGATEGFPDRALSGLQAPRTGAD